MYIIPAKVTEEICWVRIKTLVNIVSESSGRIIPKGTYGTIIESYSDPGMYPDMYAVDLKTDDCYYHEILVKNQFEVV